MCAPDSALLLPALPKRLFALTHARRRAPHPPLPHNNNNNNSPARSGWEYQAEVALLSRSMLVQATQDAEIDSRGGQARRGGVGREGAEGRRRPCSALGSSVPRSPASPLSSLTSPPPSNLSSSLPPLPLCTTQHTKLKKQIRIEGAGARGRLQGLLAYRMGQLNVKGVYPVHFHMQARLFLGG